MYSGRKILEIMTEDKVKIIHEGETIITYTVPEVSEAKKQEIEDAAMQFVQFLVEASAFGASEYTENNGKPVDY
jgi:hypothetical protein